MLVNATRNLWNWSLMCEHASIFRFFKAQRRRYLRRRRSCTTSTLITRMWKRTEATCSRFSDWMRQIRRSTGNWRNRGTLRTANQAKWRHVYCQIIWFYSEKIRRLEILVFRSHDRLIVFFFLLQANVAVQSGGGWRLHIDRRGSFHSVSPWQAYM